MCTNLTAALMEDLIEITWTFDRLMSEEKIKPWNDLMECIPTGSDGIKEVFINIAKDFEEKYPFYSAWDNGDLDYLIEIQKFAEEELIKEFGKTNETHVS